MSSGLIINISRFIILVLFQVFVLNNIQFSGYINPYVYVLFILLLPFNTPKWLLLVSAFLLGFSIDVFMKTPGMNAAASVLMGWARPGVIRFFSRGMDVEASMKPGIRDFGFRWFFMYTVSLVLFHHLFLFYLEAFRFSNFFETMYRVLISTFFSVVMIILIHYLFLRRTK